MEKGALVCRAPVRIDFAGGFTDVSPYCRERGGAVVNATINLYSRIRLELKREGGLKLTSLDLNQSVEAESIRKMEYNGNLDLFKSALKRMNMDIQGEIIGKCDAPPGSGLGTSAATAVCLIGTLDYLQKGHLSPREIAEMAHRLEREELGIWGGKQDQYASALGGFLFLKFGEETKVERLKIGKDFVETLEKSLLLCYTGKSRLSGNIVKEVMERYRRGEVVSYLDGLKEIAFQMKDALLEEDLFSVGELLEKNWEYQKMLFPSITNEYIERLFGLAKEEGAIGGKALGAGGGGCLLFLCYPEKRGFLRSRMKEAGARILNFRFRQKGMEVKKIV